MKKRLIMSIALILTLGLTGCENSLVKKSINQAKSLIEIKNYNKALLSLEIALDEDEDNEEANKLYNIVNQYQKSKSLLDEGNINEAKKFLDKIENEYINYTIKEDIDNLKQQVENKINEIELINNNLNNLLGLIDEKKYNEANTLFEEINKSSLNEEQKIKVKELKTRIDSELSEIEAQKKESEANNKKQYGGTKQKYIEKLNSLDKEINSAREIYQQGSTLDFVSGENTSMTKWDDMLNEIYSLLKVQLSETEMEELKNKQINWIDYRDTTAKNEAEAFGTGSLSRVQYILTLSEVTKDRCYELVNIYMK